MIKKPSKKKDVTIGEEEQNGKQKRRKKINRELLYIKVLYRWWVRRKGKTGKRRKVGVKKNWSVLVEPSYFPQGNWKQSLMVKPGG